jgi:Guanylylate cyclase
MTAAGSSACSWKQAELASQFISAACPGKRSETFWGMVRKHRAHFLVKLPCFLVRCMLPCCIHSDQALLYWKLDRHVWCVSKQRIISLLQLCSQAVQFLTCNCCADEYLVIILVDKCKLSRGNSCPCFGLLSVGYTGHYIVICRYDEAAQSFVVLDPAQGQGRRCIDVQSLDRARRSFGTDEDILLVSREQPMLPKGSSLHACPASTMHNCMPLQPLLA